MVDSPEDGRSSKIRRNRAALHATIILTRLKVRRLLEALHVVLVGAFVFLMMAFDHLDLLELNVLRLVPTLLRFISLKFHVILV